MVDAGRRPLRISVRLCRRRDRAVAGSVHRTLRRCRYHEWSDDPPRLYRWLPDRSGSPWRNHCRNVNRDAGWSFPGTVVDRDDRGPLNDHRGHDRAGGRPPRWCRPRRGGPAERASTPFRSRSTPTRVSGAHAMLERRRASPRRGAQARQESPAGWCAGRGSPPRCP